MAQCRSRISVVTINWNGLDDTLECIDSLRLSTYRNFSVIVVDNGSEHGEAGAVERHAPEATVIRQKQNRGFAAACNAGIEFAIQQGSDYILLLNNDTVCDKGMLAAFVEQSTQSGRPVVMCGKIFFFGERSRLWYAGSKYDPGSGSFYPMHRGNGEIDSGQYDELQRTDFATGCALWADAAIWRDIGLLDERFFAYWEDVEWSIRARLGGYELLYLPSARLWHKTCRSVVEWSPLHVYLFYRNWLLCLKMTCRFGQRLKGYANVLQHLWRDEQLSLRMAVAFFRARSRTKNNRRSAAAVAGVVDYVCRKFGAPRHTFICSAEDG